jgi:hypothetical protein
METATAMHQLPTSISTLAMCTRPMLLARWTPPEEDLPQVGLAAGPGLWPGLA